MINFERYEQKSSGLYKKVIIGLLVAVVICAGGWYGLKAIPSNITIFRIGTGDQPFKLFQKDFEQLTAFEASRKGQLRENGNYLMVDPYNDEGILKAFKSLDEGVTFLLPSYGGSWDASFLDSKNRADKTADGEQLPFPICGVYVGSKIYKNKDGGKDSLQTFKEIPCPEEYHHGC